MKANHNGYFKSLSVKGAGYELSKIQNESESQHEVYWIGFY